MKIFKGKVISKKMQKTATVQVDRVIVHPIYKKRIKRSKKYQVHDVYDTKVGQEVRFAACRPVSRTKKWKVIEVIGEKKDRSKKAESRTRKPKSGTGGRGRK